MQLFVSTLNFVIFNFEGLKLFLKIFTITTVKMNLCDQTEAFKHKASLSP